MSGSSPGQLRSGRNAVLIAAGILLSRLAGFVRERVFAHYFGNSDAADAFKAALKIPNLLQNLFGDQALSASLIPVYTQLWERDRDPEQARELAWAVGTLLSLAMAVLVLAGVLATPLLIDLIAPGFKGVKRELAIHLVRILFPGVGLLVLAAWCLGILNSHRKMFLPYVAPVLWNAAMIGVLVAAGQNTAQDRLAVLLAWGAVAGSALQMAVQLPATLRLVGRVRTSLQLHSAHVRTVLRNFLPSVTGRGVNQVAAYVDQVIASFLPTGAVAALGYAQTLYILPVSVFGMANANAELPELATVLDTSEEGRRLGRERLVASLRRVAAFVVPSVVAFVALGDSITGLVFQTGRFGRDDVRYVWIVLAASSLGLLAATLSRLYASIFWARHDTRTPLRFALVRVLLGAGLGSLLAFFGPGWLGLPPSLGLAGLTFAASAAGWVEQRLLQHAVSKLLGQVQLPLGFALRCWGAALGAAVPAFGLKIVLATLHPALAGTVVCAVYGLGYLVLARGLGVAEVGAPLTALQRLQRSRRT